MKSFYENNKKVIWSIFACICIAICAVAVYSVYNANFSDESDKKADSAQTMTEGVASTGEETTENVAGLDETDESAGVDEVTPEKVTAQAVTAQTVTAQAVTAQSVTAQAVTAQSVTAQAVAPKQSAQPKQSEQPKQSAQPKRSEQPKQSKAPETKESAKPKASETQKPKETATPKPSKKPKKKAATVNNPDIDTSKIAKDVPYPYQIKINKKKNCVTVYAMDTDGKYSIPVKAMVCSTGKATPLGSYRTKAKYVWKTLKGGVWGQYSTRIVGGILFHSVPYREAKKDTLKSSYYNKLGTTASAGCVRLTTKDAKWIYDNCPLKTPVVIYNSNDPGPLGKPSAIKVKNSNKWDPTDPDKKNPWLKKKPEIKGVKNKTIERGTTFNPMDGVTALDFEGNDVTKGLNVTSNVNTGKVGTYKIQYHIEDLTGRTDDASCTVTVRDTTAPKFSNVKNKIEGLKKSEITRARLLQGVTVRDNNQAYNMNRVEVKIPKLVDGKNTIVYKAKDDYGNVATAKTTVYCDFTAPSITKKGNAADVISLNQKIDSKYVMSRVKVSDKNKVKTNYSIQNEEWGVKITYTATDSYGNKSVYTDRVRYMEYTFKGAETISVNSVSDEKQLKKDLYLTDSFGNTINLPDNVEMKMETTDNVRYTVTFSYQYSCPRGRKTVTFDRIVLLEQSDDVN